MPKFSKVPDAEPVLGKTTPRVTVESVTPASGPQVRDGVGDADEPLGVDDVVHAANESAQATPAAANPNDFTGEWCAIAAMKETAGAELSLDTRCTLFTG